jgi:hypothetical protein
VACRGLREGLKTWVKVLRTGALPIKVAQKVAQKVGI